MTHSTPFSNLLVDFHFAALVLSKRLCASFCDDDDDDDDDDEGEMELGKLVLLPEV